MHKMRKMGPLKEDHPIVKDGLCPACKLEFKAGDYVTLINVGPGDDKEAQAKRDAGHAYNGIAIPVHWDCSPQWEYGVV